jgi:glycosyltransferase involved in cell wall biosynthesis
MKDKIVVLHEVGANTHYRSLKYFLNNNNIELEYREFAVFRKLIGSIIRIDKDHFLKQIVNIGFLLSLLFTKNKKVLLGIAPFDYRLYILLFFLRNHHIYYHTSWSTWDGSFHPKKTFVNNILIKYWKAFLQQDVRHIFTVTQGAKDSLILNMNVNHSRITVVYHSYDSSIYFQLKGQHTTNVLKFLYVGRLVSAKGIMKMIKFFETNNASIHLTVVGNGDLQHEVKKSADQCNNITYLGYIKDQKELSSIYQKSNFLLLPSIRKKNWEELFGMAMIEAMACGVVPIASDHAGPKEVISAGVNGYLVAEDAFEATLSKLISEFDLKEFLKIQNNALEKAKEFNIENISNKWLHMANIDYQSK